MIVKVISGGQTGVDIAALRAARALGLGTGGTMPKGWRTLAGPRPAYQALYGMVESAFVEYQRRTFRNVGEAGGTLRIAYDWNAEGELCTLRACAALDQSPFDIGLDAQLRPDPARVAKAITWIRERGPGLVLNVAGNTEERVPGIERAAERILRDLFERCAA